MFRLTSPRPSVTLRPNLISSLPFVEGRTTSDSYPTVSKLRGCEREGSASDHSHRLDGAKKPLYLGPARFAHSEEDSVLAVVTREGEHEEIVLGADRFRRRQLLPSNVLRLTEERLRLKSEVEPSLVDEDIWSVDLYAECASCIRVLLVMQSEVKLEIVLVCEDEFVLNREIFGVVAVDDRESTPLEY